MKAEAYRFEVSKKSGMDDVGLKGRGSEGAKKRDDSGGDGGRGKM